MCFQETQFNQAFGDSSALGGAFNFNGRQDERLSEQTFHNVVAWDFVSAELSSPR